MSTIKRLYFYGVAFVALVVATNGAALIVSYLLDLVLGRQIQGGTERVSFGLAMVVVGAPLWGLHWSLAQAQLRRLPQEAGTILRKLYVYAAMFLAAAMAFLGLRAVLRTALGIEPLGTVWTGQLIAWGTVWAFHRAQEWREGQPSPASRTVRRWYIYLVSAYSLAVLANAIASALGQLFGYVYDSAIGAPLFAERTGFWTAPLRGAAVSIVIGAAWWSYHWLALGRQDTGSILRQVYLYLYAFLGGALVLLASSATILYTFLVWAVGDPQADPASTHFRTITRALPALVVGVGLLLYHWTVVREEATARTERRQGAQRSFGYIMSALGLATLVVGVSLLLTLLFDLMLPDPDETLARGEAWRRPLALGLTFMIIGGPLWFVAWSRMQRRVQRVGLEERTVLSRRIFIYATLGILALATLGTLTGLLSMLLRDILEGSFSLPTFRREGYPLLGTVLTVGAFLPYYWQVLREDQRAGAEVAAGRRDVTLVVPDPGTEVVDQLEAALRARVQVLRVTAPAQPTLPLTPEALEDLMRQIREAPPGRVLLMAVDGAVRVYSYR